MELFGEERYCRHAANLFKFLFLATLAALACVFLVRIFMGFPFFVDILFPWPQLFHFCIHFPSKLTPPPSATTNPQPHHSYQTTYTPCFAQNNLGELFALLKFLWPDVMAKESEAWKGTKIPRKPRIYFSVTTPKKKPRKFMKIHHFQVALNFPQGIECIDLNFEPQSKGPSLVINEI